ncbi:MAG: hypothetical protein KKF00_06625 [Proteobacteria bacterium]|nr:hypothetical protein [Pseudomonadota bacterium]
MNGKERIITALGVQQPDRVPLYIHGINEAPIIGIGKHITDGLPEPKQFYDMNDSEKMKLLDTLFLIHEVFGVDGFTSFEIGHDTVIDDKDAKDDWGVIYRRNPYGLPVPIGTLSGIPVILLIFMLRNRIAGIFFCLTLPETGLREM